MVLVTRSKGTDESFSTHNASLIVFALEIRLLTMDSTPYDDSSVAVLLTMNEQGCQKKPAAGENRLLLGCLLYTSPSPRD